MASSSTKQIFLITGASTCFGALSVRDVAREGHTVYAGMYSHDGNTSQYDDEIAAFNTEHHTDLRPIALNLLDQPSIDAAVKTILSQSIHLDVAVHNAGHMNYGPAEAFTAAQYQRLYDVNVVGAHRLNTVVLPRFRARRAGHLGYFAAKAAFDSLAQSYARELHPWGVESTIVNPGVFTRGTNHLTDAMGPGNAEVAAEYEAPGSPTEGVGEQDMRGTASVVPEGAEPSVVAEALVALSRVERGKKPYRVTVDPADDGGKEGAAIVDRLGADFYRRIGLERLLKVTR